MGKKAKTKEQMLDYMAKHPKQTQNLIGQFGLLGEKNFRMNFVYQLEQGGANLVEALQAVDNAVYCIKKLRKQRGAA